MACQYFVNGEWISENELKAILIGDESGGLLDALLNNGTINELKGFPKVEAPVKQEKINKSVPVEKLQELLIKEIKTRKGYSKGLISALELNKEKTDFKIPLWASPYADKFESLLTSIVNNGVIKQKFNGRSYVLGSEEGFKVKEGTDADEAIKELAKNSSIVFTDSFDPIKGLQPMRLDENGNLLPAQIMIPFNFKNKDEYGNKLKITNFMIPGTNKIDLTKLDPKILKLFGFRIPTQGHNSMAQVEIVGFLPEASGDLMLAPKDFTVQMGSDFDVDKMFTYMYNIQLVDGKLTTEFDESNVVENLQNKILDIHHSVMSNPHEDVIRAILEPDSFAGFEDKAKEVSEYRKNSGKIKTTSTVLSDSYQKRKFIQATAGKEGVGNFSLDSTFNAIIQDKNLIYDFDENTILFAKGVVQGELSNPYTIKSQKLLNKVNGDKSKLSESERKSLRFKSEVIKGLQSSAVDNEKAQILDKLNINTNTFDAIRAMAQLGFEESEIAGLLTQDIIWEYVDFVKLSGSSLKEFSSDVLVDFRNQIITKYDPSNKYNSLKKEEQDKYGNLSGEELMELLKSNQLVETLSETPISNLIQLSLFDKFLQFSEVGKDIKSVQSAINTESSGLPKSLLETSSKVNQINRLANNKIRNAEKLLGEYEDGKLVNPTTINGFAAYHGAIFANEIYAKFFPYNRSGFDIQYNELLDHISGEDVSYSKAVDVKINAFKEMRSYLFTSNKLNIYEGPALQEHSRLFIDSSNNQSLASILKSFSDKQWYRSNPFLNKLVLNIKTNGMISRIDFEASTGENYDEQAIYLGFLDLFKSDNVIGQANVNGELVDYTPIKLAQDLISYSFLEGGNQGAKQFLKYIPIEYLKAQGFGEGLQFLSSFDYENIFGGKGMKHIYTIPSQFTIQYFQNNPDKAKSITKEMVQNAPADINDLNNFKLKEDFLSSNLRTYTVNDNIYTTQTQFIKIYDPKLKSKYALYQYDATEHVYKRIPVVSGSYGFKQYNINGNITKPAQIANDIVAKTTINIANPTTTLNSTSVKPVQGYNPNVVNNTTPLEIVGGIEINRKLGSDSAIIKDMFDQIANNPAIPKYYQELANVYKELSLPNGIKFEYTDKGKGSYNVDSNTLKLNKDILNNGNVTNTAVALLHEATHIFTSKVIKAYPNLQGEQKASVTRLNGLMNKYINHLKKEGKGVALEQFRQVYENWKKNKESFMIPEGVFTEENLNQFYGAIKLEEFVAMAQTSKEFQEILNNVKDSDGKSIFEKVISELMKVIGSLLKSIGINLQKDSLLYSTLEEIQNLIKINENANFNEAGLTEADIKPNLFDGTGLSFEDLGNINDITTDEYLLSLEELEEFKRICK